MLLLGELKNLWFREKRSILLSSGHGSALKLASFNSVVHNKNKANRSLVEKIAEVQFINFRKRHIEKQKSTLPSEHLKFKY